jgi:hypothetical protein
MGNDRLEVSLGDVASRLDSAGAQEYNAIPPREGCWIHIAPQSILLASRKSTKPPGRSPPKEGVSRSRNQYVCGQSDFLAI